MNPTKLLCKCLDREGNGYVTLGNFVTAAIGIAALPIIGMSYVRGAAAIVAHWNGNVFPTLDSAIRDAGIIDTVCIPVAIVGTGLILAIILSLTLAGMWIALEAAWVIKIAKCERKDGDE